MPDMMSDPHQIGRVVRHETDEGRTPEQVVGGELDGLNYHPVELDGAGYWLTEVWLLDPRR